jgi:dipeptidyl aminopeptidase/acylaminoacyl peptidase
LKTVKSLLFQLGFFHGLLDDVVNVDYSIAIYKKLKACNADVELTIFDDADHDSWSRYDNQEIYDWMFKQIKTDKK